MKSLIKREDLIYPELSYKIVGILFDVYNNVGPGYKEKCYQRALAVAFKSAETLFQEQVHSPLIFKEKKIGDYFFDFLIEDKVVLEIKSGEKFLKQNINQVFSYLKTKNLKLGILANFTKEGLKFRRILNLL